jgi:hypothetical protein
MNPQKYMYEFTMNKEIEIDVTSVSKNEKGEEIKTIKKEKVQKPVHFRLVKPTRKMFDEAELYYAVNMSEGIKAGMLTRSLLAKRYQDDGGAMSEPEKKRYAVLYVNLYRKQNELEKLEINLEKLPESDRKAQSDKVLGEILEIKKELQEIEIYQSSLFDQTAENRARNKTIMWWVLNLIYSTENEEKKDFKSLFQGITFDQKLNEYDLVEENDDFFLKGVIKKSAYFISLWYMGRISSEDDFKSFEKVYDNPELSLPETELTSE